MKRKAAVFFLVLSVAGAFTSSPGAYSREKAPRFARSKLTKDESESLADRRTLRLSTGEDKAVDMEFDVNGGANGIAIGNPAIVATTLAKVGEKRQIIFKPLKAGDTSVTVRDADGTLKVIFNVRVSQSNLLRQKGELSDLLKDIEGLDIRVVGQKIVVDGEVLVPADYARLLSVITDVSYKDVIMNLATLSPVAMQILSKKIVEDINVFAPNVKTRVVNGMIFLEGTTDSIDQANRAASVAKLYLPEVRPGNPLLAKDPSAAFVARNLIQNFIVVNPAPPKKQEKLVRVTLHFVELSKDYNKAFGFKWQPGFTQDGGNINIGQNTSGTSQTSGTSFTAVISSLFPTLQSAQNAGYARVLKTGTLIVRSGQPAKLEDQFDYPYTILGPNNQPTGASKPVGLAVDVTPLILGQSEDIQLDLKISQSNVVGRTVANSAPLTSKHTVETKLYVRSQESAAVAGVMSADVSSVFNKDDPAAGSFTNNTTPLFTLLRSKNYTKKKGQFVIFVTPQIVENASDGTEEMKKNFRVKVQ